MSLKKSYKRGFPVDCRDFSGRTLPLWSMYKKAIFCSGVPGVLPDFKADPNAADRSGYRPLDSLIVFRRSLSFAKRLIENGADVNACDRDGRTAFHWAAWNFIYGTEKEQEYGLNAARLPLEHGADPYLGENRRTKYRDENRRDRSRREWLRERIDGYIKSRAFSRREKMILTRS